MDYVIKVEKLSKSYESCVAVENLSFAVKKRNCIWVTWS